MRALTLASTAIAIVGTAAFAQSTPQQTSSKPGQHWHWNHSHRHAKWTQPDPAQATGDATTADQASPVGQFWTQVTGDDGKTYDVAIIHPPGASGPLVLFDDPSTGTVTQYAPIALPSTSSVPTAAPSTVTPSPPSAASTAVAVPNAKLAQPLVFGPTSAVNPPPPPSDLLTNLQQTPSPGAFPTLSCSTGPFTVANDEIIAPNGKAFVAKGINIYSAELEKVGAQTVMNTFPGMNFVRVNTFDLAHDTPASLAANVQQFRAKGVVVELEDHNYPNVITGSDLSAAEAWYAGLAKTFSNDPGVWFGSQNEPTGSVSGVNAEIKGIYAAVRGAGNNSIFLVNPTGGFNPSGLDLSGMTNAAWDGHYYAWEGADASGLLGLVNNLNGVAKLPVIIGEYGPAAGNGVDPGGSQVVDTVNQSGIGSAAWAWVTWNPGAPGPGDLTVGGSGLSQYGQTIANFLAAPSSQGATTPVSQQAGVCDATTIPTAALPSTSQTASNAPVQQAPLAGSAPMPVQATPTAQAAKLP